MRLLTFCVCTKTRVDFQQGIALKTTRFVSRGADLTLIAAVIKPCVQISAARCLSEQSGFTFGTIVLIVSISVRHSCGSSTATLEPAVCQVVMQQEVAGMSRLMRIKSEKGGFVVFRHVALRDEAVDRAQKMRETAPDVCRYGRSAQGWTTVNATGHSTGAG
jgi:hypothetical protein